MSGRSISIILGGALVALGCFHIAYAFIARLRGRGLLGGRGFIFEAEEDGDPVGFRTVVWGNAASGAFEVAIGTYLILTGH